MAALPWCRLPSHTVPPGISHISPYGGDPKTSVLKVHMPRKLPVKEGDRLLQTVPLPQKGIEHRLTEKATSTTQVEVASSQDIIHGEKLQRIFLVEAYQLHCRVKQPLGGNRAQLRVDGQGKVQFCPRLQAFPKNGKPSLAAIA